LGKVELRGGSVGKQGWAVMEEMAIDVALGLEASLPASE